MTQTEIRAGSVAASAITTAPIAQLGSGIGSSISTLGPSIHPLGPVPQQQGAGELSSLPLLSYIAELLAKLVKNRLCQLLLLNN